MSLISSVRLCGVIDDKSVFSENVLQLTLSLYLLVQCKLQLRHSITSMIDILRVV